MGRKHRFRHPRCLLKERSTAPAKPENGDEIFCNGIFRFHISALLDWLKEHPQPVVEIPICMWESSGSKDDRHVEAADVTRPIVIAEIAPDYRDFLCEIPESSWDIRGYVCIDGYHRIEKARRMGLETLPAVILRMEQHVPFLYSGYEQYTDYWNGKLEERSQDAQRRQKNNIVHGHPGLCAKSAAPDVLYAARIDVYPIASH